MKHRAVIDLLVIALIGVLAITVFLQAFVLPELASDEAQDFPAAASMRWPLLGFSILGLGCVEAGIVCTLRLLSITARGEVFAPRALRWVDGIIGSCLAGSLVCIGTIGYENFAPAAPFLWLLLLVLGALVGASMALLMLIMRTLLVRATSLRAELDSVI
jgi:hypothetical protein